MPMTRSMVKKLKTVATEDFIEYLIDNTDFEAFDKCAPGRGGSYAPAWVKKQYRIALRNKLLNEKNETFYIDENKYTVEEWLDNGKFYFSIKDLDDYYVSAQLTVGEDGEEMTVHLNRRNEDGDDIDDYSY